MLAYVSYRKNVHSNDFYNTMIAVTGVVLLDGMEPKNREENTICAQVNPHDDSVGAA